MHKKLVVFATLFCACSAISAFADPVAAAAYDNLKLSTNAWFSASVSGTTSNVVGGTIAVKTGAELTYENSKFVIDSDIDAPVTFTASNNRTNDIVMIDFDLDAAYVPVNLLASGDALNGVKIGFAISKDGDSKAFRAWVGGDWLTLTGATVPEENDDYKVIIRLDGRDQKVQFEYVNVVNSVEERVILKSEDNEWIPYTYALERDGSLAIDFVGSGAVTSFNGNQLNILAEVIVAGGDVVEVKEEDMKAFEKTALEGKTAAEFLAMPAKDAYAGAKFSDSTLKVDQAYALGMLVKNDSTGKMEPVNDGKLEIKATSAKVQDNAIAVGFASVTPRTDTGATFSYQLKGLKTGAAEWTSIGDSSTSMPSIPVSAVGTYDFFKVVTTVTFPSATK